MSKVDFEASRGHWTEVDVECCTASGTCTVGGELASSETESMRWVLNGMTQTERLGYFYKDNTEVMRNLQRDNPEGEFF